MRKRVKPIKEWLGAKNGAGTYQQIINLIPRHQTYVEPFLGTGAILRHKKPALRNIAMDLHQELINEWLKSPYAAHVEFSCYDALKYLNRIKKVKLPGYFIYLDPPYLPRTRTSKNRYKHELTEIEHVILLNIINELQCNVMISCYPDPLYQEHLSHWNKHTFQAQTRSGKPKTEYVYFNYEPPTELHDYSYIGSDYREREDISRQKKRMIAKFASMPDARRNALLEALFDEFMSISEQKPVQLPPAELPDEVAALIAKLQIVEDLLQEKDLTQRKLIHKYNQIQRQIANLNIHQTT